jgi:hypothetical protein
MAMVCNMAQDAKCPGCVAGADRVLPTKRRAKRGSILAKTHPAVASEWFAPYNGWITPSDVNRCSHNKYWWKCQKHGVVWEADVESRTSGHDCPLCLLDKLHTSNSRPKDGESLADAYPEMVESEWDFERNVTLSPYDLKPQSHVNVFWKCRFNEKHKWAASPHNRINGGTGCPHCSEWQHTSLPEKTVFFYVKQAFPDALEAFNPNTSIFGRIKFDIFIPSIRTAIEYDGQAWHRSASRDTEKDYLCFENNIQMIRIREPECPSYDIIVSTQYYYRESTTSNESLDKVIRDVLDAICPNHQIDVNTERDTPAILSMLNYSRAKRSVAETHPELVEEWLEADNGGLTLDSFRVSSDYHGTWTCSKGHKYIMSIRHRCNGHGCLRCALMKPRNGKSLRKVSPRISEEWVGATDGSSVTPDDVGNSSGLEVRWKCSQCGTEWVSKVSERTYRGDNPLCTDCRRALRRTKKHPTETDASVDSIKESA